LNAEQAMQGAADILRQSKKVIGIGSPRASIESNFALRELVGANMMDTTPAETFALMTPRMVLTLGLSGVLAAVIAFWVKIRPA
ncbi:phosphoethanolamine transferase domain-containing protein, partial [Salmonella enterica subsp. enterica serovar Montevideo]|nr:phosphoethanolamine transferase domain-containing protein [Salmonella enterica subsp. enterica serovar Montevideo]